MGVTGDFEGHEELWRMSVSFVAPLALKAAISLGIADILDAGPKTVQQIFAMLPSKGTSTCPEQRQEYLARLLRLMAASNVFRLDPSTGEYALTRLSRWLVTGSSFCLVPYVLAHLDMALFAPFDRLPDMILGDIGPGLAFESSAGGTDFWGFCDDRRSSYGALFNEAMAALSRRVMATLLASYDGFAGIRASQVRVVDVGGGLGLCTKMMCETGIRAINFDQPSVVSSDGACQGIEHIGGDMFGRVPAADALFMKAILHDWDDERCKKILANCYRALPRGGKLIIVEMVVDESTDAKIMDVLMMAVTKGRERTRQEWFQLLHSSSFEGVRILQMPMPWSVIEARKPS